MSTGPASVLDASALLAYLRNEPGAERVRAALSSRAAMSAVNWAEVLSKLSDAGIDADEAAKQLFDSGLVGVALQIHSMTEPLARSVARLRPATRPKGLSLGVRPRNRFNLNVLLASETG